MKTLLILLAALVSAGCASRPIDELVNVTGGVRMPTNAACMMIQTGAEVSLVCPMEQK